MMSSMGTIVLNGKSCGTLESKNQKLHLPAYVSTMKYIK